MFGERFRRRAAGIDGPLPLSSGPIPAENLQRRYSIDAVDSGCAGAASTGAATGDVTSDALSGVGGVGTVTRSSDTLDGGSGKACVKATLMRRTGVFRTWIFQTSEIATWGGFHE